MNVARYFDTDDGSLPEIEIQFVDPTQMQTAFSHLFSCDGVDASLNGTQIWLRSSEEPHAFSASDDASFVISGAADPFHVVLQGIKVAGTTLPAIGVFVDPDKLTLDYRTGSQWGRAQVDALFVLLHHLQGLGGKISVPWWGTDGEREFQERITDV